MPLHKRVPVRTPARLGLCRQGPVDQPAVPPIPDGEMRPEDAFQCISDELLLDGNERQNMATFCQTWEEAEVHKLMDLCINKNMIDKDEYPQTAEIERRCVQLLADLWNAPEEGEAVDARPSALRRRACSGAWRPSGGGGPSARPRKTHRQAQHGVRARPVVWTNLPSTGTSRCGRSPCRPVSTTWTSNRCWPRWTRTPSWWFPPSE